MRRLTKVQGIIWSISLSIAALDERLDVLELN